MPNYKYIVDILAKNGQFVQAMNQNIQKTTELDKKVLAANKSVGSAMGSITKLAGAMGIAFGGQQVAAFLGQMVKLSGEAEGVRAAFDKIADGDYLENLRKSVKGTVSDLELMKRAVMANNFGIPLKQLGSLFEFATKRAQDTGQSVDYLVESIILGIGRKSPLILDNLGISAVQLREKFQGLAVEERTVADIAKAVGEIATDAMKKTGGIIDTNAIKIQSLSASWDNFKLAMAGVVNTWESIPQALDGATESLKLFSDKNVSFWNKLMILMGNTGAVIDAVGQSYAALPVINPESEGGPLGGGKTTVAVKTYASTIDGLNERLKDYAEQLKAIDPNDRAALMNKLAQINAVEKQIAGIDKLKKAMQSMSEDTAAGFRNDRFSAISGNTANVSVSGSEDVSKWTSQLDSMNSVLTRNKELADSLASSWNSFGEQYWNVVDKMMKGGENINAMHIAAGNFVSEMMGFAESGANSMDQFAEAAREAAMKVINTYIAEGVAGAVSTALAKSGIPFPLNMVAGAVAAAGATTLFNSMIPAFNFGGEVPGSSFTGDRMLIRANSGEEVLTRSDPRHRLNRGGMASGGSAVILQPSIEYGLDTFRIRLKRVESNVGKRT